MFIEKGKIIESGTHDELIKMQGFYFNMMNVTSIETDESGHGSSTNEDENENENVANEKLVEKQLFADSQHFLENSILDMDDEEEFLAKEPEEPVRYWATLRRIMNIAKPEWFFLFLAMISALFIGASFPGFAILFGEFYGVSGNIKYGNVTLDQFCILLIGPLDERS